MSALPASYVPTVNRCVTATDGKVIGIGFDCADGAVIRVSLNVDDAEDMATTILQTLIRQRTAVRTSVQPVSDSGMPSAAVSPHDGVKV